MATTTTTAAEENPGRIYIKDLPEDHSDYDAWRYTLCAQVLRAAPDPVQAMHYLRELDDENVASTDLPALLDVSMNRVDVSLFAAIVGACQKGHKAIDHLKMIQSRAAFGCGRQALRVLDERHKHEGTHMATKANSEIQKLTCAGLEDLGPFLASFQLYRHQMGTGEHKLTNAMGISLLKDKLRGVNELKATFALWSAGNSTDLDALLQAIESLQAEYLDEIERRNARKAVKAAAAAQAAGSVKGFGKGKKGKQKGQPSKVTCTHCGKPNHEAKQCWLNPSSSSYRPELASKAAAKAALNPPPGLAGSSASSSSNNSRAATTFGANEALTKAFAEFLSKKFAGVALDVPVEVTQNMAQFASGAWALDSGASQCVVNSSNIEDQHWDTLQSSHARVEGVTGQASSTARVDVDVPHLGRCNAIVMDGSVNMACMGEACEDLGYNFFWPAWSKKPHFWKEGAVEEVPLVVHSRVPFLLGCIGSDMASFMDGVYDRLLAAVAPDLVAQLAPNFLQEIIFEFFESIVDEFQNVAGVSGLAAKSVGHLHSLTHLPADPSCPICVQAKITKTPAIRKQEESKDVATSFGDRIHCDLVGPTRASINDEVYAMVTRDEATNYPSVRALRNKSSEETVAAWKDMYGGFQIRSVRTDNGGEFDGHFHEDMVASKIRHERSLPNRPQTNARAERFHRTLAEGMRSLMLMSGVPYVFWAFCLTAFVFLYARTAPASGQSSPFELRFGRPYNVESLHPFGSACYFLEEQQLDKFEPRGRLGVVLGYGRLHSYVVLDFEHYTHSKGEVRIINTRDVRFLPEPRFPFHELQMFSPDAALWVARLFSYDVELVVATAGDDGRCKLCQLWPVSEGPITCKACLSRGRKRHDLTPGCVRGRCHGHASLDSFVASSVPVDGQHVPHVPPGGDGGLHDLDLDDDPIRPPPDPGADDALHGGGGHSNTLPTDGHPFGPLYDPSIHNSGDVPPRMDESNPTTPLPSHPFGPQFDPTIHDSGQVPPNIHGMNPTTPQAERGVVRPRSRETTPSDGPPHKFHMLPPLVDNQNVSQSINLGLPGPSGEPNSDRSSSNTGSNDSPGSHRSVAQSSQHDSVSHASAAIVSQCFGLTTKNIEPWDPLYNSPPAQQAKKNELESLVKNSVLDMSSLNEWNDVRSKDHTAEVVGAKMLVGIKDYELLHGDDLADAVWKGRMVCTGNCIKGADGKMVWNMDALYAAPVDLHNTRLVVLYGALHGVVWQADVKSAYLQAPLGGNATWLRLPASLLDLLPPSACDMKDPVLKLNRALYGHPRAGSDWDAYFALQLNNAGWHQVPNEKSLWKSPDSACMLAIYVDDLLLGGPEVKVSEHMLGLQSLVHMGKTQVVDRFLGTTYHVAPMADFTVVTLCQPAYAQMLLHRYKKTTGITGPLRKADTPMIDEDVEGQWGDAPSTSSVHAMTHLGGLLFLVRSSRPDLAFAVNFVARFASKWTVAADKRLKRIFEYLESTLHFGIRWQVHPASIQHLIIQVHVDADHGGCLETARSTSGWNVFVTDGHGMLALVDWASRR